MLKKEKITDGCYIISSERCSVMAGCPSDIIKILKSKHIDMPANIAVPDMFFQYGINLAATEFPIADFIYGRHSSDRMNIIGSRDACSRQRSIIGETSPFLKNVSKPKWISDPSVKKFAGYDDFFRSKKTVNDNVFFVSAEGDGFDAGGIIVRKTGPCSFEFESDGCREYANIVLHSYSEPLFGFLKSNACGNLKSGLTVIGSGSGFSPYEEDTSCVIWADFMPICIDGNAWQRRFLRSVGIDPSSVPLWIITHNHDDHAAFLDAIVTHNGINLMTTREIFDSFVAKSSAILGMPSRLFRKGINFIPVVPGERKELYGISFEFHETVHSIPCVGVKVNDRILVSGDTAWGSSLKEMMEKGIVSSYDYDKINSLPYDSSDFIFMDAGGPAVHPDIKELSKLPESCRRKMVLNHISVGGNNGEFFENLGFFGRTFIAERGYMPIAVDKACDLFSGYFMSKAGPFWRKAFMANGRMLRLSQGKRVRLSEVLAFVVSGTLVSDNGEVFKCGDAPGAGADIYIKALSDCEVMLIKRKLFNAFLKQEHIFESSAFLFRAESELLSYDIMKGLSQSVILEIASSVRFEDYDAGDSALIKNSFVKSSGGFAYENGRKVSAGCFMFLRKERVRFESDSHAVLIDASLLKKSLPAVFSELAARIPAEAKVR